MRMYINYVTTRSGKGLLKCDDVNFCGMQGGNLPSECTMLIPTWEAFFAAS